MRGNPDAVASAYSLYDYQIADDLGGEAAYADLRDRAWPPRHPAGQRHGAQPHGHRLALGHRAPGVVPLARRAALPGLHLQRAGSLVRRRASGSTSRTTTGTTAMRRWSSSGSTARPATTRYVYHGNDGTSFPWNDTAQLDFLDPAVREQVIQTILHVARRFPIIRFDAAMTLAKKHIQRLWFPEPGAGGAIPSRAEHAMPQGRVRRAHAGRVLARGGRPRRGRGPRHAAAGRGVLDDGGLLRPDARHAPRLQQRVHAHAARRGQRELPQVDQGDHRVRPGDPQALRQLHEQPRREDRDRAVRQGRQVLRRRDRDGDAARACRCSATARSRGSARSTAWSSGARRSTSSRISG